MRKLLDAAMVAFDKRGYHATRVNDVVEIAKTSHGTFYLYFSNKEDLLRALVTEAAGEAQKLYDALSTLPADGGAPQWDDVHGWVRAYSKLWTRYAPLFRSWTDLATIDPELIDVIRHTFTVMSGALSNQIGPDSSGHIIDPDAAGMATLAMLDRFHYLREFVGQPDRRRGPRDDDDHGVPGPLRPERLSEPPPSVGGRLRRRREHPLEDPVDPRAVQGQPAVNHDVLPGHEPGQVGAQEDHDVGHVLGLADPADRRPLLEALHLVGHELEPGRGHGRADHPGDTALTRIDGAVLQRSRRRQRRHGRLAGRVRPFSRRRSGPADGRRAHDGAAAARQQVRARRRGCPAQTPVRLTRSTRSHSAGSSSCSRLKAAVPALL